MALDDYSERHHLGRSYYLLLVDKPRRGTILEWERSTLGIFIPLRHELHASFLRDPVVFIRGPAICIEVQLLPQLLNTGLILLVACKSCFMAFPLILVYVQWERNTRCNFVTLLEVLAASSSWHSESHLYKAASGMRIQLKISGTLLPSNSEAVRDGSCRTSVTIVELYTLD